MSVILFSMGVVDSSLSGVVGFWFAWCGIRVGPGSMTCANAL